jgi:hypothetical protein
MPIIFIMSAMVSGIALCVLVYFSLQWARRQEIDMRCLDTMAMFLFYSLVVDAAIEGLDWIHAQEKLFYTLNVGQALLGTAVPLIALGLLQLTRKVVPDAWRKRIYFSSALLIMIGVLAMRWNVVIGGQMFSKSLRGLMSYKMEFAGLEGWFMGGVLFCLPFVLLTIFIRLFLPLNPPGSEETLVIARPQESCAVQ